MATPTWQQLVLAGAGAAAAVYLIKRLAPNPGVVHGLGDDRGHMPYPPLPRSMWGKDGPAYCARVC